jgi:hypothetical protein
VVQAAPKSPGLRDRSRTAHRTWRARSIISETATGVARLSASAAQAS